MSKRNSNLEIYKGNCLLYYCVLSAKMLLLYDVNCPHAGSIKSILFYYDIMEKISCEGEKQRLHTDVQSSAASQ